MAVRRPEITPDAARLFHALNQAALAAAAASSADQVYPAVALALYDLGYEVNIYERTPDGKAALREYTFARETVRRVEAMTGLSAADYRIDPSRSWMFERVLVGGETVVVEDTITVLVDVVPGRSRAVAKVVATLLGIRRMVAAPIRSDDAILGMLVVLSDEVTSAEAPAVEAFARVLGHTLRHLELLALLREKMQELEAAQARQLRAHRVETIGRLTAGIAHDVNNLLTPAFFAVDMLRPQVPEKGQRWLGLLGDVVVRTRRLTQQLLALGRRQHLQVEVLALDELIQGMGEVLAGVVGEDCRGEAELAAPQGFVRADRTQLEQLLVNLVVNARDAVPPGGRVRWSTAEGTAVLPGSEQPVPCVELTVTDDGAGIPPNLLTKVFDPFYTTKEASAGAGLGLAVVEGIVDQHGGSIHLESLEGRGTRAVVRLPRVAAPPAFDELPATPELASYDLVLWLVEDRVEIRTAVATVLCMHGVRVFEAADLAQARMLLATRSPPDVVVSDILLPDGEGMEFVAELRAAAPDLCVVFMSGHPLSDEQASSVDELGDAYLAKPFSPGRILGLLGELLASRQAAPGGTGRTQP